MRNIRVAYCTGFWYTNIGNGFFNIKRHQKPKGERGMDVE